MIKQNTNVSENLHEFPAFAKSSEIDTSIDTLGTNTESVRRFRKKDILSELGEVSKTKAHLWAMRDIAGKIPRACETYDFSEEFAKIPRVSCCGRKVDKQDTSRNILVAKGQETGKLFYNGLIACGSVWRCPVCSFKIMKNRQIEVFKLLSFFVRKDVEMSFVTLTIRHKKNDSLFGTLTTLNEQFRKLQRQRNYKEIKACYVGMIKTVEITYGVNGWHPHLHILFVHNQNVTQKFAERKMKRLISLFVKRKEVNALVRSQNYKPIYNIEGIKDYITKWDCSREMTCSLLKKARGKSSTPFGMLSSFVKSKSAFNENKRLFKEYVEATFGKTQLLISPAIRKYYKEVNPDTKRDDEIVKNELIESLVASISPTLWRQIRNTEIAPLFLEIFDKYGQKEAVSFLYEKCDFLTASTNEDLKIIEL